MVGDTLKKAGDSSQNTLVEIKDVGDTQYVSVLIFLQRRVWIWGMLNFHF